MAAPGGWEGVGVSRGDGSPGSQPGTSSSLLAPWEGLRASGPGRAACGCYLAGPGGTEWSCKEWLPTRKPKVMLRQLQAALVRALPCPSLPHTCTGGWAE